MRTAFMTCPSLLIGVILGNRPQSRRFRRSAWAGQERRRRLDRLD